MAQVDNYNYLLDVLGGVAGKYSTKMQDCFDPHDLLPH